MLRIGLFLLANFSVLTILFIISQLLGLDRMLGEGYGGLFVFAAIIGFAGSFISLLMSKWLAKKSMGVRLIDPRSTSSTDRWLLKSVEKISRKAGIAMPEVGVFEGAPNAFATGWKRNDALVAVSTGLLRGMSEQEIEGVLGHEIAHVANGDMVTQALLQGLLNTFVIFFARIIGQIVDKAILKNQQGYGIGYYVTVMIAEVVLTILASLITMWFSRYREYRADYGGAKLTDKNAMIAALKKLQQLSSQPLPEEMRAFGISGGKGGIMALFATHPPLEARIAALKERSI